MQKPSSITEFFYNFGSKRREVVLFPLRHVMPQIPKITNAAQLLEKQTRAKRYNKHTKQTRQKNQKSTISKTEIYQFAKTLLDKHLNPAKNAQTLKNSKRKHPTQKFNPKQPSKPQKKWQKTTQEYNQGAERYGIDFCEMFLYNVLADIKQNINDLEMFCREIKKGHTAKTLPKSTSNAFFYGVAQKNPRATQIILCGDVDIRRQISAFFKELNCIENRLIDLLALIEYIIY